MKRMKNKKGITLVSLVVTIIVLIILAGVSINLTLGENGIITMAKRARENMELAKVDEERQLNELYMQMEQEGISGGISYDAIAKLVEFKRQIASAITDMGIETAENADASTMSSNIRSLTGASSADKVSYDNTNSGLVATNVQGAVDELNESLGGDENGMTVHEKLDYLMNNGTGSKAHYIDVRGLNSNTSNEYFDFSVSAPNVATSLGDFYKAVNGSTGNEYGWYSGPEVTVTVKLKKHVPAVFLLNVTGKTASSLAVGGANISSYENVVMDIYEPNANNQRFLFRTTCDVGESFSLTFNSGYQWVSFVDFHLRAY